MSKQRRWISRAAQSLDLGDYFTFKIERLGSTWMKCSKGRRFDPELGRNSLVACFEVVTVDVGFVDWLDLPHDRIKGPDYFGFAGDFDLSKSWRFPSNSTSPKSSTHIHVSIPNNRQSTRVKDLVDLVLISSTAEFEAGRLR